MIKNYTLLVLLIFLVVPTTFVVGQNSLESSNFGTTISEYLNSRKTDFNFENEDIERLVVTDEHYSENTDLTHVYVNQTYQGIRIFNAISSIAIRDNQVFYYANRFHNNITGKVNGTNPSQTQESAITSLSDYFQLGTPENLEQLENTGYTYTFTNGAISRKDIKVELVYTVTENELKLAWDVLIYALDDIHWYSARVDAFTNEIIEYNNLVISCTFDKDHTHNHDVDNFSFYDEVNAPSSALVDGSVYNVFALPTESPNHGPRQIVTNPASTLASPFGWHDDDGVPGPEHTDTRGNNVLAQEDRDGIRFTPGYTPDGTASLNFDFPLDLNQPPAGYEDVSITNLFYMNNMMHDIWYHHGFTEESGNFQKNNYGNGGAANDLVVADAQDGSGLNNATFATPVDGQSPSMTMFLWNPPGPLNAPLSVNNGSVAGDYDGREAAFGGPLSTTPITTNLILATDGTTDFNDVCQALTNSAQINGNIAVIRRGTCEFGAKVFAVQNAGAVAAIIVNNEPNGTITMAPGDLGNLVNIPSIMVSQTDGEAIISALENGENLSATLVNNGPYLIDGDLDNGIIAHEYGHGISTRLTAGPNAVNCLFNEEQMGEGWSDWFGLMVTMKSTDTAADARGIGTFAISQPPSGNGIRPRRYSPDFAINEFTYDITNNPGLSVPHGVGSMWATVLWDLTWAYIDKYGFDPDLFTGDGGNNKVMKLVVDGLKLQPCSPGFIDGRDALLAADLATTGGVDQCIIWDVFAKRGLGFNASQGLSSSRADQIEDFSLPPDNDPSLANCSSLSVDDFSETGLTIYPNPTQTELTISTTKNYGNVTIVLVDINGRVVLETRKDLFNEITLNTSELLTGIYILTVKGDSFSFNEKIIKN